jgi:hypothetical protein
MQCQLINSIQMIFFLKKILRYQQSWVHKQSTQLKQITVNRYITSCEMKDSSNSVSNFTKILSGSSGLQKLIYVLFFGSSSKFSYMKPVFVSKIHVSDPRCGRLNFTIMMGHIPIIFWVGGIFLELYFTAVIRMKRLNFVVFATKMHAGCSSVKIEKIITCLWTV